MQGWKKYYGYGTENSLIEWISGAEGGIIESVNASTLTISATVDNYKADVINIIPAQKAGAIAFTAGLVNQEGWCPINQKTFESRQQKDIYIIGDASIASPLPKSGYAANSEAKVCASAVVASLNDQLSNNPILINTCYSLITPTDGISAAMVYRFKGKNIQKIPGAGGLTPINASTEMHQREADYAHSWFNNITTDIFGS